jgi:predicted porin
MTKLNSIIFILIMALFGITINTDKAYAKNSIYGRLDIALSSEDTSSGSYTDVKSHASRVGFKGSQTFDNGVAAIYQYEWQTDPIDGDPTFKQRNSFVGLQGAFGKVFLGMHDTPTKKAQGKIDLFNDTAGDIKNILWGENRSKKIIQWSSPKVNGFTLNVMGIVEKADEEAFSVSLDWKGKIGGNKSHFAVSFDSEVPQKGYFFDTTRFAATIPLGKPLTLGVIWQESEDTTGKYDDDGYVISLKMKMSKKITLKAMYGESDMVKAGGELTGIGFDYKIAKPLKVYLNYVDKSFNDPSKASEHIMAGIQYKFSFDLF